MTRAATRDISIRGIDQLADVLGRAVPQVGAWPLFAYLRYSRWDVWRTWFEDPMPVIEARIDDDEKLQIYLGGDFSPLRASEPPLEYASLISALGHAAGTSPHLPIYAAGVARLATADGEEYEYTLNLPIRTMKLKANQRNKRVELTFYVVAWPAPEDPA